MEQRVKVKRRRLNYCIKRDMQIRIFLKILFVVFVSTTASAILFYFFAHQEVGQTYYQVHIKARTFLDYLWPVILAALGVSILIGGIIALFLPHCIAGPLYRLEREIKGLGEGDLTLRLKIRKGDDLQEFVDNFNESVERLHAKVSRLKRAVDEAKRKCEEKQTDPEIKALILRIEDILSEFKL